MRIKIKQNVGRSVAYKYLSSGDAFYLHGEYCMKMPPVMDKTASSISNCVVLDSGDLRYVEEEKLVVLIDCELVVNTMLYGRK